MNVEADGDSGIRRTVRNWPPISRPVGELGGYYGSRGPVFVS